MAELFANSGDPDQMLHSVVSDLGLHCLPNNLLGLSRLQWAKHLIVLKWCLLKFSLVLWIENR